MSSSVAVGPCFACGQVFPYVAEQVCSVVICDGCMRPVDMHMEGCNKRQGFTKRPLCLPCVRRVNPMRSAKGLEPFVVRPGAYGPLAGE